MHGICGCGKHVLQTFLFGLGEFAENVSGHGVGLGLADADFEAGKGIGAEMFDERFDAIVPTGAAFFTEPETSEREADIVINDETVLRFPFEIAENFADGAPAEVHESLRFGEENGGIWPFGDVGFPFGKVLKMRAVSLGEQVEQHETNVVASAFIFSAWVTKSDDEFDFAHGCWVGAGSSSSSFSHSMSRFQRLEIHGLTKP